MGLLGLLAEGAALSQARQAASWLAQLCGAVWAYNHGLCVAEHSRTANANDTTKRSHMKNLMQAAGRQ